MEFDKNTVLVALRCPDSVSVKKCVIEPFSGKWYEKYLPEFTSDQQLVGRVAIALARVLVHKIDRPLWQGHVGFSLAHYLTVLDRWVRYQETEDFVPVLTSVARVNQSPLRDAAMEPGWLITHYLDPEEYESPESLLRSSIELACLHIGQPAVLKALQAELFPWLKHAVDPIERRNLPNIWTADPIEPETR